MVKRRWGARAILWPIVLVWSASCAGPGAMPRGMSDAERSAYEGAIRTSAASPETARAEFERFVGRFPTSPMADDALLQLAELDNAAGRPEDASRWLGTILTQYPESDSEPVARLRLAQLELARDRRTAARALLDPVEIRRLSAPDALAVLELRVSLAQTPVERMRQLARYRSSLRESAKARRGATVDASQLEARRRVVDQKIDELIATAAAPELEAMLDELGRRSPSGAIALELARRSVEGEAPSVAQEKLARAESLLEDDGQRDVLTTLERRLTERSTMAEGEYGELPPLRELSSYARPDTRGASGTIGVVLPLSGDFAEFGESSLRGILLAAGAFDEDGTGEGDLGGQSRDRDVRIVIRDTGNDPERAAAAVRQLAEREDLVAIVGPIFSDEALASAEAAQAAGIPLVTLSNREDVTQGRPFVLRTRTTPADEVRVLVDHAIQNLGARRFGVLYPRTRYGRGMRKLYADAVAARGGRLVTLASYSPDETDFSSVIREMVGFRFLTSGERQAIAVRDRAIDAARSLPAAQAARARNEAYLQTGPNGERLPPIVDFDVLFIPDSAEAVAMIAPGLALQGVHDAHLLGSSDWLDEELLRGADRHVAGAVVSAPFYVASDVGVVREFADGYRRTFGLVPDAFAAQGYDAANLVLQQLSARRRDRASVRDGMLAVRAYPGASGSLSMLPDGNARRRPFLLEVSGQRFVPLD
ncbi:MAG: ABC transporter substrate-binding protein [Myxococcota bacterium]